MDTYEIRIHSLLDLAWQETFNIEMLTHDTDRTETILRGELDQAQLQGILNRIHEFGLQLMAVNIIKDEEDGSPKRPA